jgi:putative ABC transport system permease protein
MDTGLPKIAVGEVRAQGAGPQEKTMFEDISLAVRGLRRNPSFALLSVLVLGLGIGATTTVFSAVDAVLLRPLPYPQADRLAQIILNFQARGVAGDSQNGVTYRFLLDHQQSFSAFAASVGNTGVNLVADGKAAYVRTLSVSRDYFRVFGFEPALGRGFSAADEDPGAAPVAMLNHATWQTQFGARPDIIGQKITLTGLSYTIVGVMPERFRSHFPVDVWTPLKSNDPRGVGINYLVVGRLKDDVTIAQADAEMTSLTKAFLEQFPRGLPDRTTLGVRPLQEMLGFRVGQNVLVLFGAVLAMLLIVCANTASLTLVRALNRQREFAVRAAIGASRWQIIRQVLIESLLLSVLGSIVGLFFAQWGIAILVTLDPDAYVRWNLGIDVRVLAAVAASSLVVGVVVGLFPAFQSSRIDIRSRLLEEGRQSASHRVTWWRRVLVVVEIAACLVLLSAAGLLIRSYIKLQQIPLGFDGTNVITAQMSLQGPRYDSEGRTVSFAREALDQIRALPGVEAAAIASNLPAQRGLNVTYRTPSGELSAPDWRYITPDYFKVFRIPLMKGRYLQVTDEAGALPAAVVNEQFARLYFKDKEVIGAELTFVNGRTNSSFNVVGVIGDVKSGNFRVPAAPTVFVTLAQSPPEMLATAHRYFPVNFAIRTASRLDAGALTTAINGIVSSVEPDLPLASIQSMDQIIGIALRGQRSQTVLLVVFAALALVTAASGIYGLISYSVATRSREFGIRIALGATYSNVMTSIVRQGLMLAVVGTVFGLAGALSSSQVLRTYLFGITAKDPWTFLIASLVLVIVSITASTVPALRVLKLSPSVALREE